jgi:hypothetical protein
MMKYIYIKIDYTYKNIVYKMSVKKSLVLEQMYEYAPKRASIPNANNGRAYMACLVLDEKYYLLCRWL